MSYLDNNEIIYYCMLECSGDSRASTRKVAPIMDTTKNTAARLCVVVKVSELPTGDFRVTLALSHNFTHGEVLRLYHAQDYIKQLDHLDEENQQLIDDFMIATEYLGIIDLSAGITFRDSSIKMRVGGAYNLNESIDSLLWATAQAFNTTVDDMSVDISNVIRYYIERARKRADEMILWHTSMTAIKALTMPNADEQIDAKGLASYLVKSIGLDLAQPHGTYYDLSQFRIVEIGDDPATDTDPDDKPVD